LAKLECCKGKNVVKEERRSKHSKERYKEKGKRSTDAFSDTGSLSGYDGLKDAEAREPWKIHFKKIREGRACVEGARKRKKSQFRKKRVVGNRVGNLNRGNGEKKWSHRGNDVGKK